MCLPANRVPIRREGLSSTIIPAPGPIATFDLVGLILSSGLGLVSRSPFVLMPPDLCRSSWKADYKTV